MHLKQTKRNGRTYLSVVQSYRDGGRTRTRTIESLGYVDELAARYDDPIAHFRSYVDQLNAERADASAAVTFSIPRDAQVEPGRPGEIALGAGITLAYLDAFGVGRFLSSHAGEQDGPEPGRMLELLVSARMMHAAPKHETWDARESFPRTCKSSFADLYRALPLVARQGPALVAHLGRTYVRLRGERNLRRITLVLSNYVFRWSSGISAGSAPDEASTQTLRRLCVAIDGDGIPLTYRIVASELAAEEVVRLVASVREEVGAESVTLVCSRIGHAAEVAERIAAQGDSFVMLWQLDESAKELTTWTAADDGYRSIRSGMYGIKSRVVRMGEGAADFPVRQVALRGPQLSGADPSSGARRSGAMCIVSNMTSVSEAFVFNIYRELWRVHEPFQVESADFVSAPYAVSADVHLEAHFVVCFAAFFLLRAMRRDIDWRYNAVQVANALIRLVGTHLADNWYLFSYRDEVTDAVEAAVGMDVGRRIMSRNDIRSGIARAREYVQEGAR